jgi:hypothetical protein
MKRFSILTIPFVLGVAVWAESPPRTPSTPFPRSGEFLRFEVYWTELLVGKVDITNYGTSQRGRENCYKVEGYARTTGAVENLYSARFRYTGYLRPDHSPWIYEEWEKEKDWRLTEWLEFPPGGSLVRRFKKNQLRNELPIPPETFDPVSAVYSLMTLPLKPGSHHRLTVTVGKDLYEATADVAPGPVLETLLGPVKTIEVTPHVYWHGQPLGEREYKAWFTADSRQIPVQLYADIEFGSFSANLVKYVPPTEGVYR